MNLFPDRLYFNLVFSSIPNALVVWNRLVEYLDREDVLPKLWEVMPSIKGDNSWYPSTSRLKLSSLEVSELLRQVPQHSFWVDTGHSSRSVGFSLVQDTLYCRVEALAKAPNEWSPMLESVMSTFECVGGWQWMHRYRVWQRIREIHESHEIQWGMLPPGYRKWSEPGPTPSLTPQPDRTFIDISLNPGRAKELSPSAYFYPTAEMWLGPGFWKYAKCTKEEALAADFFIAKRDTPHFLYLKCWPEPFTRPDGEQGRMQQRLWKLFFQEDCEWPPGSGTICEEPMYGPPELMPDSQRKLLKP